MSSSQCNIHSSLYRAIQELRDQLIKDGGLTKDAMSFVEVSRVYHALKMMRKVEIKQIGGKVIATQVK